MSWWPPRSRPSKSRFRPLAFRTDAHRASPTRLGNQTCLRASRSKRIAPCSAISNYCASGHSNVGHHDINAVPFGVSVSSCVTSHCDTLCPWLGRSIAADVGLTRCATGRTRAGGSARIAVPSSHLAKWRGQRQFAILRGRRQRVRASRPRRPRSNASAPGALGSGRAYRDRNGRALHSRWPGR